MKVRLASTALLVLAVLVLGPALIAHEEDGAGVTTVQGEVLDLACYVAHESKGEGHAKCAEACVKGGQPMGLLAADGTVYLLVASHEDGAPFVETKNHAGKQVEIKGKTSERGGIKSLEVSAVSAM